LDAAAESVFVRVQEQSLTELVEAAKHEMGGST